MLLNKVLNPHSGGLLLFELVLTTATAHALAAIVLGARLQQITGRRNWSSPGGGGRREGAEGEGVVGAEVGHIRHVLHLHLQ